MAEILVAIYKMACLVVGLGFGYMGYRLFTLGIVTPAGDGEGEFKGFKISLRAAAPGTFFSVLGAIIIVATILMKFNAADPTVTNTILDTPKTIVPLPEPGKTQ